MKTSSTQQGLEFVTIWEAAQILRCKPYPVMKAINKGKLVAFQPIKGGAYLIRPDDLRAFVEATKTG